MERMLFITLPVRDVGASTRFYQALGFEVNAAFTDEETACLSVSGRLKVMLLRRDRFAEFVAGRVTDPADSTSALLSLVAPGREEVDATVETALRLGGRCWQPPVRVGPFYGRSFTDPDGHVWESVCLDDGGLLRASPTAPVSPGAAR